jgi:4-amino-4-deoxy-L-arabinose transferase-like glycosyltransferase
MSRLAESVDAAHAYVPLARHLYQGYIDRGSHLFAVGLFRTPGYPVFLSALFAVVRGEVGAVVVQALIGLGVVVLTFRLAASMWSAEAGLWAAALVAFDLPSIAWGGYLQPETLYALLFLASMSAWLAGVQKSSLRLIAASGLLLGLSCLVRPVSFYLLPLLGLAALVLARGPWPRRLALVGVLAAAFAISAGPWFVRNEVVAGLPAMSSADGYNLLVNDAGGTLVESQGLSYGQASELLLARVRARVGAHASAGDEAAAERSVAIDVIAHNPGGFAVSELKGTEQILFGTAKAKTFQRLGRGNQDAVPRLVRIGIVGASLLLLALTYIGFVVGTADLFRTRRWQELAAVFVPVVYMIVVTAGPVSNARFRVPFMPLIAVMAGGGLALAWRRIRFRRHVRRSQATAAAP